MKRALKIVGISLLVAIVLMGIAFGAFIYKVKYGFPIYEDTPPEITAELGDFSVLVFSKTNGYRHKAAIEAAKPTLEEMAEASGWSIFLTDNGAVFNEDQLRQFDVVVWNNVTGRVLNEEQRTAFENYIETGGGYVGIHGAGDDSHHWDWYYDNILGANFSHHPMNPQLQEATMTLECDTVFAACDDLAEQWLHAEEWYIFYDNPRENGKEILYTVDESTINPDGSMGFLNTDKNYGMGDDHPIVWYDCVGSGRAFYSALGHTGEAFAKVEHLQILKSGIEWAGGKIGQCPN